MGQLPPGAQTPTPQTHARQSDAQRALGPFRPVRCSALLSRSRYGKALTVVALHQPERSSRAGRAFRKFAALAIDVMQQPLLGCEHRLNALGLQQVFGLLDVDIPPRFEFE